MLLGKKIPASFLLSRCGAASRRHKVDTNVSKHGWTYDPGRSFEDLDTQVE